MWLFLRISFQKNCRKSIIGKRLNNLDKEISAENEVFYVDFQSPSVHVAVETLCRKALYRLNYTLTQTVVEARVKNLLMMMKAMRMIHRRDLMLIVMMILIVSPAQQPVRLVNVKIVTRFFPIAFIILLSALLFLSHAFPLILRDAKDLLNQPHPFRGCTLLVYLSLKTCGLLVNL